MIIKANDVILKIEIKLSKDVIIDSFIKYCSNFIEFDKNEFIKEFIDITYIDENYYIEFSNGCLDKLSQQSNKYFCSFSEKSILY